MPIYLSLISEEYCPSLDNGRYCEPDKKCIYEELLCDGEYACSDGSDEAYELCKDGTKLVIIR